MLLKQLLIAVICSTYSVAQNQPSTPECPDTITMQKATGSVAMATSWTTPMCFDRQDNYFMAECNPPSGKMFDIGFHIVTCTCMDSEGWQSFCTFLVIIEEDRPPDPPTCPETISVEVEEGENAQLVDWELPLCVDDEDGNFQANCSVTPNSYFSLGATNVTCICTDTAKTSSFCVFSVVVHEHINIGPSPPVCPPSQSFNINPIKTVDVTQLAPNCSDPEDGDIKANCLPATLSRSSIGETTVICQCTDSQNLKSIPCVFSVQILMPPLPVFITPTARTSTRAIKIPDTLTCPNDIQVITKARPISSDDVSWMPPRCSQDGEEGGTVSSECTTVSILHEGENMVVCTCSDSTHQSRDCNFTIAINLEKDEVVSSTKDPEILRHKENLASEIVSGTVGVFGTLLFLFLFVILIRCHLSRSNRSVNYNAKQMVNIQPLKRTRLSSTSPNKSLIEDDNELVNYMKQNLQLCESIGSGSRSKIYRGTFNNDASHVRRIVAVKVLTSNITTTEKAAFMQELSIYKVLDPHRNIVEMLGCSMDSEPFYLVMEYLPSGDLHEYLQSLLSKKDSPYIAENFRHASSEDITQFDLISFGTQIAQGMEYLHSCNIIHRNLSASHILLGTELTCKISGFSRAIHTEAESAEDTLLNETPIRWAAPETLKQQEYNKSTDVWSFGVVLWEIVTFGCHPYPIMSDDDVMDAILSGYRLPRPDHCLQPYYKLMLDCWSTDPARRPTMRMTIVEMDSIMEDDQGYLVLELFQRDKKEEYSQSDDEDQRVQRHQRDQNEVFNKP